MYRPPLRHVLPHMATGVDIGPRLRDSGDIGLIAAASAPVRLCAISMAVASPYFSSPLRITDLWREERRLGSTIPKGTASQPCRRIADASHDRASARRARAILLLVRKATSTCRPPPDSGPIRRGRTVCPAR